MKPVLLSGLFCIGLCLIGGPNAWASEWRRIGKPQDHAAIMETGQASILVSCTADRPAWYIVIRGDDSGADGDRSEATVSGGGMTATFTATRKTGKSGPYRVAVGGYLGDRGNDVPVLEAVALLFAVDGEIQVSVGKSRLQFEATGLAALMAPDAQACGDPAEIARNAAKDRN